MALKERGARRPVAPKKMISAASAAKILGCSQGTVYHLLQAGHIVGYQLGERGWWKIDRDSVHAFLEKCQERM